MGYAGKLKDRQRVISLRKKGLSFTEILTKVSVSKDSISRWCRNIQLSDKQYERLVNKKIFGQKKGSIIASANKRKARLEQTRLIFKEARNELGKFSKRDRFIAGIALYAGEGNKSESAGGFSNSNPLFIKFMIKWFREFSRLSESKYRGLIWLHKGLNENNARNYWSKLTNIPINQFNKTYRVTADKKNNLRKNIHEYGVFSIRFSDVRVQRKLLGWICALFPDKIIRA
jgi:hypothetical protein